MLMLSASVAEEGPARASIDSARAVVRRALAQLPFYFPSSRFEVTVLTSGDKGVQCFGRPLFSPGNWDWWRRASAAGSKRCLPRAATLAATSAASARP